MSNSEGTSPMIGDGYTGSIDEFSGSIDLLDSLANGSNRISITTIYNKCSADKVRYLEPSLLDLCLPKPDHSMSSFLQCW